MSKDMTEHPEHYTHSKMECWDWYELAMTSEEFVGAMKNNIWKYTYRCGHKNNDIEDLRKVINYAKRWIRFIEAQDRTNKINPNSSGGLKANGPESQIWNPSHFE